MKEFTENMGKYAIDRVSGFEGIITSITLWDRGNIQYGIQPKSKDGILLDANRIDNDFMRFIKSKSISVSDKIYRPFNFDNGMEVKSLKSGFLGYVVCKTMFINGCKQYNVTGAKLNKDLKEICGSFDEIDLLQMKKTVPAKNYISTGGPASKVVTAKGM